jgi:hypothetical protein
MGVASLVLEFGGDEDLAIAALLHDVVEDCGGAPMLKEVRRRFGSRVAKIVDGCTDSDTYSEAAVARTQRNLHRHLKNADADTRLVSAADKLNNVRSILSDYREVGEVDLVPLQWRARGHSLVLSGFAGGISSEQAEPFDSRVGTCGRELEASGERAGST